MPDKIDTSLPTVLYGAGKYAKRAYMQLQMRDIQPVCFVDADSSKWSKPAYEGCPLTVFSLDEAAEKYGEFNIYAAVGLNIKYEVITFLTDEMKIPVNRIINYEHYTLRTSCALLETTMTPLGERDVGLCRGGRFINITEMPTVEWTDDAVETLNNFLELRQHLVNELKDTPEKSPCNGCIVLREQMWPEDYKVSDYVLSTEPDSSCQFKCVYCYSGHYGNSDLKTKRSNDIRFDKRVDLLLELETRGLANPSFTKLSFSDGELCVDPKRDNLFALAEKYMTSIYTNAGVYHEKIASLLEREKTTIIVSVDAGTKETFKSVKGADSFDKVCENLRRYAAANSSQTWLQYIFLPGKNDNDDDINGFISLCNDLKTKYVFVLVDVLSDRSDLKPDSLIKLFKLIDKLLLSKIKIFLGGNVSLSVNERRQLRDIAYNTKDDTVRDEWYYETLNRALNETVY